MATGDKTASFAVKVDAQSNAKQGAAELQDFRKQVEGSQDAVKAYSSAMKSLRGASDEVKAAKESLKAKIEAEQQAISRANLAILKQGTTYDKLAKSHRAALADAKKETGSLDATKKAISQIGGPVSELAGKVEGLKTVLGGATSGLGAMAVAGGVAAAAVALLSAGVIAGVAAFGRFVIEGANAARTMNLMREAAGGSAANATALGHQIDELATKVATPKAELNELSLSMTRAFLGSRVSGAALVDTFNAVAQESEVMGKAAGSQIQGIIDRAKTWGRMSVGLFELQGTGISFEDVAGKLAKQLHIGLEAARFQLRAGWTDVNQGAKAIRSAIEEKFASINLRKMLDVDVVKAKFKESLAGLTAGVNLEPLLVAFKSVTDLFSTTTMTGAALKDIVTDLGNALVGKAAGGASLATMAIKQIVIWAYKADIAFLQAKAGVKNFAAPFANLITSRDLMFALKGAVAGVAIGLGAAAVAVGVFVAAFKGVEAVFDAFEGFDKWSSDLGERFRASMKSLGKAILEGLTSGLRSAWDALKGAVAGVAESVKSTFKNLLGIHSPSKVFEEYGQQTAAGYAGGVESGRSSTQRAIESMAPIAPVVGAGGGGGFGGGISVPLHLEFHFGGVHSPEEAEQRLRQPDVLAGLTKAIEDALKSAGIPTQRLQQS